MNTTMYDQLAKHAPVPQTGLDHLLPALEKPTARPVRRRLVLFGAIAAVTAGLVIAPVVLPNGAAAAAVDQLSVAAGRQPAELPAGVLHQLVTNRQKGMGDRVLESWMLSDGSTWRRDVSPEGTVEYYAFEPLAGATPSLLPQDVANLPTDPAALDAVVRQQVSGSMSIDEAVFVYYGDALRLGYVPPTIRKAMLAAMSRLPHITVESSSTIGGRPCQKVTYSEPLRFFAAGQSYCFDPATTQIVEEQQTALGSIEFRSTVTTFEYVAAVPDSVKTEAANTAAKDQAKAGANASSTPSAERTPR